MSIKIDHARFNSVMPDIAEPALTWINQHIEPTDTLFEWGSGGSTFWFADRVKQVYSVEHQLALFIYVKSHFLYEGYHNINMIYASEDTYPNAKYVDAFDDVSYRKYCETIHNYPSKSFDWVIINGKSRGACLELAVSSVKHGGVILINDTNKLENGAAVNNYRNKALEIFEFKGAKLPYSKQTHTTIMRMA